MDGVFLPALDMCVLVVPFLAILAMAMFGLDERLANPSHHRRVHRSFCGVDRDGRSLLSDPDGSPWMKKRPQIEAKLIYVSGAGKWESSVHGRRS